MRLITSKSILRFGCVVGIICLMWIIFSNYELQAHEENLWRSRQQGKPDNLLYILLWSGETLTPFTGLGTAQKSFTLCKCQFTNCHVTANRSFFGGDIRHFDVVAFMGRDLNPYKLPLKREAYQKYIYFNMESSANYPVYDSTFDGFFNWTSTYRLDSEIPIPYILVKDKKGNKIGPKKDMDWSAVLNDKEDFSDFEFDNKTKAAAIFVSHCDTKSGRQGVVNDLSKELSAYNLTVDIYGACGPYSCPRDKEKECDTMLATDYYFYLSFENSFDIDYVTEKVLTALRNNVVPVVYGAANYSRFLPPGSYLNAREISIQTLARTMVHLMNTPKEYRQYFKWKKYYTYHDQSINQSIKSFICRNTVNSDLHKEYSPSIQPVYRRANIKNCVSIHK